MYSPFAIARIRCCRIVPLPLILTALAAPALAVEAGPPSGLDAAQWQAIKNQIAVESDTERNTANAIATTKHHGHDPGLFRTTVLGGNYDGLPAQANNPGPEFGYSVSMDGDWLAVGAPGTRTSSTTPTQESGAVFLFRREGGQWQLKQRPALGANYGAAPRCGTSVSLRLPHLLLGCPGVGTFADPDDEYGRFIFFRLDPDTGIWGTPNGSIIPSIHSRCGTSVAVSATGSGSGTAVAAIGCPGWNAGQGRVATRVYDSASGTWTSVAPVYLTANDGAHGDGFGQAVAIHRAEALNISVRRLAVGAPTKQHGNAILAGSVYMFEGNNWSEVGNFSHVNPDQFGATLFGSALAINSTQLIVGVPGGFTTACPNAPRCGTVRRYQRISGTWQSQEGGGGVNASGNPPGEQSGMRFGAAVALGHDNWTAVAAPQADGSFFLGGTAANVGMIELRRNGNAVHGVSGTDHQGELRPGSILIGGVAGGRFGTSLAFGNRRLAAGYPRSGSSISGDLVRRGSVWIYEQDRLFVDDFDGPDVVQFRNVNHALVNTTNGTSINWLSGAIVDTDPVAGYDINLYGSAGALSMWWNYSPDGNAGRAPGLGSSNYNVLPAGTVLGPGTPNGNWSRTNGAMADWRAGGAGYLGFRFDCSALPSAPANGVCYGYAHLQTTAPNGYPATLRGWSYNRRGHAITTASLIDP